MKKILTILASAVLALTMSSCVKDTTVDGGMKGDVVRTIGANIEAMQSTRATMPDFEVGEKVQVVWEAGDVIGVVTAEGATRKATLVEGAGTIDGVFNVEGAEDENETYVYGFYPYNDKNACNGTSISFLLNEKRRFITNPNVTTTDKTIPDGVTLPANELPMVAKANGVGGLTFKSVCGIIEIKLTGEGMTTEVDKETGESVEKAYGFFNVALQSDANRISGWGSVDMTAANPTLVMNARTTYAAQTNENYTVGYAYMQGADNSNGGIQLNKETPTSVFFVMPLGTYTDLKLTVGSPALCVVKESSKAHEVKANTILSFSTIDVDETNNYYTGDDVTDLSVNPTTGEPEYAMCYLARTSTFPKKFKYTALSPDGTKKMKLPDGSVARDHSDNYNTTYVMMEDTDGVVSDIRREGNVVYFTANKPGNAIVAIGGTNMKRIYSNHVWVSDVHDQVLAGNVVVMDRNLGATYAPQNLEEASAMTPEQAWRAAGNLYQWGNPAPKVGATANSHTGAHNQYSTAEIEWIIHQWNDKKYGCEFFQSRGEWDVDRAQFYINQYGAGSGTLKADDTSAADGHWSGLWAPKRWKTKNYHVGENALWQSKKTHFDPCPPGYRVSSREEIGKAFTNSISGYSGKSYKVCLNGRGQYMEQNGYFVFVSWAGLRTAGGNDGTNDSEPGVFFNGGNSSTPRMSWWFFDESLTVESIANITNTSNGNHEQILYGLCGGGKDIKTANATGKYGDRTYPFVQLTANSLADRVDGEKAPGNPFLTHGMRHFLGTGCSVRCVRQMTDVLNDAQGPAFEVDTPTDF